jgi:hypothetical protein
MMSFRETIARWICPSLAMQADRYHYLWHQTDDCHRWLAEFPDASDVSQWLKERDYDHWRKLEEPATGKLPYDIGKFREALRARRDNPSPSPKMQGITDAQVEAAVHAYWGVGLKAELNSDAWSVASDSMRRALEAAFPPAPQEHWVGVAERCAERFDRIASIIDRNLYHQHEKIEDAKSIAIAMREELKAGATVDAMRTIVDALEWYGEQARLARLLGSEGDPGRWALDADGGKRARSALTTEGQPNG